MTADRSGFSSLLVGALIAFISAIPAPVGAEVVDADWADPNFAFCEDLGVHASGRVRATAKIEHLAGQRRITSLSLSTTHTHAHRLSGTVGWKAADGRQVVTTLQEPWFDVISAPSSGQLLVLPRNGSGTGPSAQMGLDTERGTPIRIKLRLLFTTPSGNCPTSFDQTWNLP